MTTRASNVAKIGPRCDRERQGHASHVDELAQVVYRSHWDELSGPAREQLKSGSWTRSGGAGCSSRPVVMVRAQVQQFSGAPLCTLIGSGRSAPDRAALYNGALMRLDFNDSPGTRRDLPSERHLAAVLVAAESRTPTVARS